VEEVKGRTSHTNSCSSYSLSFSNLLFSFGRRIPFSRLLKPNTGRDRRMTTSSDLTATTSTLEGSVYETWSEEVFFSRKQQSEKMNLTFNIFEFLDQGKVVNSVTLVPPFLSSSFSSLSFFVPPLSFRPSPCCDLASLHKTNYLHRCCGRW
jgi:hypothetical protein